MRELFIYYRIDPLHSEAALALVLAAQARLRQRHDGLLTRLLRRPELDHDRQTWMEIYAFAPGLTADAPCLTAAVETDIEAELSSLAPLLAGARHVEVFIACA